MEGYTEEEFEAMMRMIGMWDTYVKMVQRKLREPPATPLERMELVDSTRSAFGVWKYMMLTEDCNGRTGT